MDVPIGTTQLIDSCLHNGRGKAATLLASRGAPLNLEAAAGAGQMEAVRSFFDERGLLRAGATQRQLQRGFLWACGYGHYDVVKFLLPYGADLTDQADTSETALHWAVISGDVTIIRLLLEHGAPLEDLNAYGGTALGQAEWSFANGDPAVDYVPVFETLLAAGARIQDGVLAWLDEQETRPAAKRAEVASVFRRYGAIT